MCLITDNGPIFTAAELKEWCAERNIKLDYASVYQPQTNRQVERTNGLILAGIKPRLVRSLENGETKWVEELDSVLWSLRTTPNCSTGYTPFFMVNGAEAILPSDLIHDSPRVHQYKEQEVERECQDDLDTLDEERDMDAIVEAIPGT